MEHPMNRKHLLPMGAAALLTLAGLGAWTWTSTDSAPGTTAVAETSTAPGPTTTRTSAASEARLAATLEFVEQTLATWQGLHDKKGKLSLAETKALIAERDATAEALADAVGRLPADDIGAVHQAWRDAEHVRDQLVLVEGLGRSAHAEAVDALEDIYDEGEGYTNRSHVLRSLGDSPAAGHNDLLAEQMSEASDERLSQLAAQALYGEAEASGTLAAAVGSDLPIKTRLEAIHSLGATGTAEAKAALEGMASDDTLEARVRAFASKELERSFG
jgi:hypothetical protein